MEQADNVVFNIGENTLASSDIQLINDGIIQALNRIRTDKLKAPNKIAVVNKEGKVKTLTVTEINNGARF